MLRGNPKYLAVRRARTPTRGIFRGVFLVDFKPGVQLDPPTAAQAHIVGMLTRAALVLRQSLVVTCGREAHAPDDPHTRGLALDVRADFDPIAVVQFKAYAATTLGPEWTVLYECPSMPTDPTLAAIATVNPGATGPHCHVQPVKGTTWPPIEHA